MVIALIFGIAGCGGQEGGNEQTMIVAGDVHTYGLRPGALYCRGPNGDGQLGKRAPACQLLLDDDFVGL